MRKIVATALLAALSLGLLSSCKKEHQERPVAPYLTLSGFKKDISTAD